MFATGAQRLRGASKHVSFIYIPLSLSSFVIADICLASQLITETEIVSGNKAGKDVDTVSGTGCRHKDTLDRTQAV